MKHAHTAVRVAAVVSSAMLAAVYVSCQSQRHGAAESGAEPVATQPAILPGPKSAPIEQDPALFGGSKSDRVFKPGSQAPSLLIPSSKSAPVFSEERSQSSAPSPQPMQEPQR